MNGLMFDWIDKGKKDGQTWSPHLILINILSKIYITTSMSYASLSIPEL
jgi:hypothetical protein